MFTTTKIIDARTINYDHSLALDFALRKFSKPNRVSATDVIATARVFLEFLRENVPTEKLPEEEQNKVNWTAFGYKGK